MTDETKIAPALTEDEWRTGNVSDTLDGVVDLSVGIIDVRIGGPAGARDATKELAALIALANAALPDDDPRKITREWERALIGAANQYDDIVEWIRAGRITAPAGTIESYTARARHLVAMADALASYLPPEAG